MKNLSLEARRRKQDDSGIFTIGKILNRKIQKGIRYYLIKWRDYPSRFNSWEPKKNLKEAWDLIEDYDRELAKKKVALKKIKIHSDSSNKPLKGRAQSKYKKNEDSSNSNTSSSFLESKNQDHASSWSSELKRQGTNEKKVSTCHKSLVVNLNQVENYPALPINVMKLDIHLNGKLSAQIKWENEEISSVNYENFKMRFPIKLLDFFESRIIFPFDNEGTKRYQEMHKSQE